MTALAGLAVLLGTWFWLAERNTSDLGVTAPSPSLVGRAELPPKPTEKMAKPLDETSGSKAPVLFEPPGPSGGKRLDSHGSARMQATLDDVRVKGRAARVEASSFAPLRSVAEGQSVRLPLLDRELVEGVVNIVETEPNGWRRIGGALPGSPGGTFTLAFNGREARGLVRLEKEKLAYEIAPERDGVTWMTERPLAEVLCLGLSPSSGTHSRASAQVTSNVVPIHSSRPGAPSVLYLDFDGEVVRDSGWNDGRTITAAPSGFNDSEVEYVWQKVAADYAPFQVDVTTDAARYWATPPGRRMRCIITPSRGFAPNYRGVALLGSFFLSGNALSATVPCWVFDVSNAKTCGDIVSHELGHTFGLLHDGRIQPREEYYSGHGEGRHSWGPIMGAPVEKTLTQWSRGEYPLANNLEDDVGTIASVLGYVADGAGSNAATAHPLKTNGRDVRQGGVISFPGDEDLYSFISVGGLLEISPRVSSATDLPIGLRIEDDSGRVLGDSEGARLTKVVPEGRLFLRVRGMGKTRDSTSPGYPSYGSLGTYKLTGTAPLPIPLKITSPNSLVTQVGSRIAFPVKVTDSSRPLFVVGTLPPGLHLNERYGFEGQVDEPGHWEVTVGAKSFRQLVTQKFHIYVAPKVDDLATAINSATECTTSGSAPWIIDKEVKFDIYASARTGAVADGQSSVLRTQYEGPGNPAFRWRVDSEQGGDFLIVRVDGVERARISGVVGWERREIHIGPGSHVVEWAYEKNGSGSVGADAGWVDRWRSEIYGPPAITSPKTASGIAGQPFTYRIVATEYPTLYQAWSLPAGLTFDSATATISGVVAQAALHKPTMVAENEHGRTLQLLTLRFVDPNAPLGEVLDAPTLNWIGEGDAAWQITGTAAEPANGSAQAGAITDGAKSVLRTTVSNATHVRFRWKVDCEAEADYLAFFVDGAERARISGEVDWKVETFAMNPGDHTIEWWYVKDGVKAIGADSAWVDRVEVLTNGLEINRALGEPGLHFRAIPADSWKFGTEGTYYDPKQAESLPLADGESATIETEIEGPAKVEWRWVVSCEDQFDYFDCTVDGEVIARITGSKKENNFVHLSPGQHKVAWSYRKDLALRSEADHAILSNVHIVSSPLAVHLDGVGKVTAEFSGVSERQHGTVYTVTAKPTQGSTFGGWTSNAELVSASPTLTFTMEMGLELTAHFTPGPFTLLKGRYLGLFAPMATDEGAAGLLNLQVTPVGAFSGTLSVRGNAVPLQGHFTGDRSFLQNVRMPDGSVSELFLSIDITDTAPRITGTLTGPGVNAALAANRAARDSEAYALLAGPYTALLETQLTDTAAPGGIGFATGEITASGKLLLAGKLGDGKPFSLTTRFAENAAAPVYLWAGNRGSELAGTIRLEDAQLRGTLRWRQPTGVTPGFDTTVYLRGSPYVKPAKGAPVFPDWLANEENGWITLGDIVGSRFTLGLDRVPHLSIPNEARIKLSLSLANGLFSGSFRLDGEETATPFSGALLPAENRAGGNFRLPSGETETVRIEAAP